VEIIDAAGRYADPGQAGAGYVEHLRRTDLSLGTYCLRAGAVDRQSPHAEDEVYVVTTGRGRFTSGGQTVDVVPGTVLFVAAHEPHRFHDITADLALLVFFGPAEGSRDGGAEPVETP
jgi:mannose-6-phosphate isomerase-like protein (cupin superfamily)